MNTVYFDLDGVITYPGIARHIVRPLQEQGKNIKFWTFATPSWAYKLLDESGLSDFANPALCLHEPEFHNAVVDPVNRFLQKKFERDAAGIRTTIEGILGYKEYVLLIGLTAIKRMSGPSINLVELLADEVRKDLTTPSETSHLWRGVRRSMENYGLSTSENDLLAHMSRVIDFEEAMQEASSLFKYPPFLREGNQLLVESDCSDGSENGRPLKQPRRSPWDYGGNLKTATEGKYSLILVPEHPDVWNCPNVFVRPEEVARNLRRKLLDWNGQHIVSDLGIEMGVYQEGVRLSPERE